MRNLFTILTFIFTSHALLAQNKGGLFFTYSLSSALPAYNRSGMDGGPGYDGKQSSSIGLRYIVKSNKPVAFETGIEYGNYKFNIESEFYPGTEQTTRSSKAELITIPVYANLTFLKYAFINGGALIDIEINKQNTIQKQSGIGFGLGLGGKYNFNKISIFVNPFLQRHAFLSLEGKNDNRLSLVNPGVRVGMGYTF